VKETSVDDTLETLKLNTLAFTTKTPFEEQEKK